MFQRPGTEWQNTEVLNSRSKYGFGAEAPHCPAVPILTPMTPSSTRPEPIPATPFAHSRVLGALILVDTASHRTAGAVLVR